jgi:hypothetical protein
MTPASLANDRPCNRVESEQTTLAPFSLERGCNFIFRWRLSHHREETESPLGQGHSRREFGRHYANAEVLPVETQSSASARLISATEAIADALNPSAGLSYQLYSARSDLRHTG